jgi:glycerol uptake facilitator-like aquaporin
VAAGTSGGHFHPAFTLIFATFRGFPKWKVPFYIVSQILGAFIACALVYAQWHQQIKAYEAGLRALGAPLISATGPAGIFCAIPVAGQKNGYLFLTEFFADMFSTWKKFAKWFC